MSDSIDSSSSFDNSNLYEGLFLMSQSAVGGGVGAALDHVRETLGRIDAEVITLRKWDERKLAYSIKNQKRGLYLLSMFRADGAKLAEVENVCNLSELVQRVMITRCDHMGQVEYDAEIEEAKTGEAEQKLREEKADQAEAAKAQPETAQAQDTTPKDAAPDAIPKDAAPEDAAPVVAE